jgi:hypothetical protein
MQPMRVVCAGETGSKETRPFNWRSAEFVPPRTNKLPVFFRPRFCLARWGDQHCAPHGRRGWPEAARELWLQLLEGSFKLIYRDKEEGKEEYENYK